MRNNKQHNVTEKVLQNLVDQFPYVSIAYEEKDQGKTYVSYYLQKAIEDTDAFWDKLLEIEDILTLQYGDDQILFSENESLFKMSDKATYIYGILNDLINFKENYHFETNVEGLYSTIIDYYMAA